MKTTDHPGWDGTEEGGSNERLLLLGEQIKLDCYWAIGDGRTDRGGQGPWDDVGLPIEEVQIGGIQKSVAASGREEEEESLKQMFRQLKAIKPGQTAASFATASAAAE